MLYGVVGFSLDRERETVTGVVHNSTVAVTVVVTFICCSVSV